MVQARWGYVHQSGCHLWSKCGTGVACGVEVTTGWVAPEIVSATPKRVLDGELGSFQSANFPRHPVEVIACGYFPSARMPGRGRDRHITAEHSAGCRMSTSETFTGKTSPSWVRTSDLQVNSLTRYRLRHGGCAAKCHLLGLNQGPSDLQSDALPTELKRRCPHRRCSRSVVVSTPDLESGNPGSNPGGSVLWIQA